MSGFTPELLARLCMLARRLREENADFVDHHEDGQRWYNRGYANGMIRGLQQLLGEQTPCDLKPDDEALLQGHEVMAWGRAYLHGEQVGQKETYEIAGLNSEDS